MLESKLFKSSWFSFNTALCPFEITLYFERILKTYASFQGFYIITSVVVFDLLLIVYSNFMTTEETVKILSPGSGDDLRKPRAIVSQIFSNDGLWLTVSQVAMK